MALVKPEVKWEVVAEGEATGQIRMVATAVILKVPLRARGGTVRRDLLALFRRIAPVLLTLLTSGDRLDK